jgi:hypothetical protein
MKAISLLQPWATLIVIGAKQYETRSRNTQHRGRILIHASLGKNNEAIRLSAGQPFEKFIKSFGGFYHLPFGAIIGEASISYTVETENVRKKIFGTDEWAFGDYSTGRMAWKLTSPIQYKNPIPCKGALSIWEVPGDIFSKIK